MLGFAPDLNRRMRNGGLAILGADCDPHLGGDGIGQFMERQRGDEADHAGRHEPGNDCQIVIGIDRLIGQLVETASEADDLAAVQHARDGGRGDAGIDELRQARDALQRKERAGLPIE